VVVINRGSNHGLKEGNTLSVWQSGQTVTDPVSSGLTGRKVQLPDNMAGHVMVVKAYPRISYALVMEAISEMRVSDKVRNP
jgi:hypothetical protein